MIVLLRLLAALAILATGVFQAGADSRLDVPYGPAGAENTLDVQYQPGGAKPLIVFAHGGGWQHGDKKPGTRLLARSFSPTYTFASVNYRLAPGATIKDAASDVARVIGYLQQHAAEYAIDPTRIVLMGHSAGAHLVALVATDGSYLAEAGVAPETIRGVVMLDCIACDIEAFMEKKPYNETLRGMLGTDRDSWRAYSPVAFARSAAHTPPFMVTYSPDRRGSALDAQSLSAALAPHCPACVSKGYSKEHMSFVRDLANPDDAMTKDILDFIKARLGR
jgi:acetyl esterase/lipase